MNYEVEVSIAALLDIEQAMEWYEEQSLGLSNRLKSSLYKSLQKIESNPYLNSKKYKDYRVEFIKSFPYGIHYIITENKVKVFGFFHMKRDPISWLQRLK